MFDFKISKLALFCFDIFQEDNSLQRSVAAITASIAALLKAAFSRARIPAIVVPEGEVTLSKSGEFRNDSCELIF